MRSASPNSRKQQSKNERDTTWPLGLGQMKYYFLTRPYRAWLIDELLIHGGTQAELNRECLWIHILSLA